MALAIAVIAAGCGSDSSGEKTAPTVSIPVVTSPGVSTSAQPTTTKVPKTTAGTTGSTTFNPNAPDSATNDVPPAKGSPEEQFEKQCKQNPSACG